MEDIRKPTVLMYTVGSRGDVQPYLAFAKCLLERNVHVIFATHAPFEAFVSEKLSPYGEVETADMESDAAFIDASRLPYVSFLPLEGDPGAIIGSEVFRKAVYEGGVKDMMDVMTKPALEYMPKNMEILHRAFQKQVPDYFLLSTIVVNESISLARHYHVPSAIVATIPFYPSSETVPVGTLNKPLPIGMLNSVFHSLIGAFQWKMTAGMLNKFREEVMHVPPADRIRLDDAGLVMNIYSPTLMPTPKDWPDYVKTTGFWILPSHEEYTPPAELSQFLDDGDPPVYMGFGSMPVRNKTQLYHSFCKVLAKLGRRGIYCGGLVEDVDGLENTDHVLTIASAPHEWLLPRCAMAIHDGGAGTTAASTRAKIPTCIFPLLVDQPFWAQKIVDKGAGINAVVPLKDLTEASLEEQISHCLQETVVENARALGEKIRAEPGAEESVEMFLEHCRNMLLPRQQDGSPLTVQYASPTTTKQCMAKECSTDFGLFTRQKCCAACGGLFCSSCSAEVRLANYAAPQRCCKQCIASLKAGPR